jgi:pimeloyl-ACP methyl ester carboxylesterase
MPRPNYIITPRHYCALTSQLFPDKVGSMVLDGAVDPSVSNYQQSLMQAIGFNTALNAFIADCLTQRSCPLPIDKVAAAQSVINLFSATEYKPLVRKKKVKGDSREFPFFIQWLTTDHHHKMVNLKQRLKRLLLQMKIN